MKRWDFPGTEPVDVRVSLSSGHVTVTAAPADGIVVTAEPEPGRDERLLDDLQVSFTDGRLEIVSDKKVHWGWNRSGLGIRVAVPAGSSCAARTADADVSCDGELGSLDAKTASGDVTAEHVTGPASAMTASGDIRFGAVREAVSASTASGDITVHEAAGDVDCKTVSGDVGIGTAAGSVNVHTASGDVQVASVSAGTVSLVSMSGDLDVGVAPGIGLYLDLSALSGRISNELADGDSEQAASVRLTCRSVSGDVRVHRAGHAA